MLVIRLQRMGKKKSPSYRLVVSEKTKDPQARSLEILGHYNPVVNPKVLEFKEERIKHWLSKGAQASPTVHNLLVEAGIATGDKHSVISITKKRQGNMDKKKADAEEAAKQAAEAAEAEKVKEAEESTSVEETPETPVEEKKEETGDQKPETGNEKQETEEKKPETENTPAEETPETPVEEKKDDPASAEAPAGE